MKSNGRVLRSHPLTEKEMEALNFHAPAIIKGNWTLINPPVELQEVIMPLHQAVEKLHHVPAKRTQTENTGEIHLRYKREITSCVMREMVKCKTGYWEWSSEKWRDVVLGANLGHRLGVIAAVYILCGATTYHNYPTRLSRPKLYQMIFGKEAWHKESELVRSVLSGWHFACKSECGYGFGHFSNSMAYALLDVGGSTKDITYDTLVDIHEREGGASYLIAISQALKRLGIINQSLYRDLRRGQQEATTDGISWEWLAAFESWRATSTSSESHKNSVEWAVQKVGRWLNIHFPAVKRPEDWTPAINTKFLAAVHEMKYGDYVSDESKLTESKLGQPLSARTKASLIDNLRLFFAGLQRKKLATHLQIDPNFDLETPKSIKNLFGPNPRDIEKDIWLRIVWASLNLTDEDCKPHLFPLELIRALAVVWTHCGLRSDELIRLTVGCITPVRPAKRSERQELGLLDLGTLVCELRVPAHKTGPSFLKAVPKVVEKAICAWEAVRGENPKDLDNKTGKYIDYLFVHRRMKISKGFLNKVLIPLLCKKAGVENFDHRGRFTSHRGRSSIATALYNSDVGMSLDELRRWLGHKSLDSTRNYVRHCDRRLAEKFARASAPSQLSNILTNQEKQQLEVYSGAMQESRVELEDGWYCTNPLYEQCANKDACAGCMFHAKETPADEVAKVSGVLLSLSRSDKLSDTEREAVKHSLALLGGGMLN